MEFEYSKLKDEQLKAERGIGFEDVIKSIRNEQIIRLIKHKNTIKYPHQKIMEILIEGYVYCVPFIETQTGIFLKTIYPSRKATKNYSKELR